METPQCPECEKMFAVKDKSQTIGEFLEWLSDEKHIILAEYDDGDYEYCHHSKETLLAEFFNIDLNKVEEERRVLLEHIQNQ